MNTGLTTIPLQPVQVPQWRSNFVMGIETKFKDFSGEI